jgi:hypothetical protein
MQFCIRCICAFVIQNLKLLGQGCFYVCAGRNGSDIYSIGLHLYVGVFSRLSIFPEERGEVDPVGFCVIKPTVSRLMLCCSGLGCLCINFYGRPV